MGGLGCAVAGNIAAVGCWQAGVPAWFAAYKIETPAPTTSPLAAPPLLVTQIAQVW